MNTPLWTIFVVIFATVFAAFAAVFLKKSSDNLAFNLKFFFSKTLILSLVLYGISTIFYFIALKFGELSILYPMVASVYIWICLLSRKMLGENMNFLKWVGIAFIILGVTFLGLGA